MLAVGFEPTISAGERPQTYAWDRAATGTGRKCIYPSKNVVKFRGAEKEIKTWHCLDCIQTTVFLLTNNSENWATNKHYRSVIFCVAGNTVINQTAKKMTNSKNFNINKRFQEKFKWRENEYNFFLNCELVSMVTWFQMFGGSWRLFLRRVYSPRRSLEIKVTWSLETSETTYWKLQRPFPESLNP